MSAAAVPPRPAGRKIVFDFSGVLFRWHPPALVRRELPDLAPDEASALHWADAIFQNYVGDWAEFDRGTVSAAGIVGRIVARTGLAREAVRRVVDGVPHELRPIEPSVALLQRLRDRGRPLFYLSNMPAPYADLLEARHAFIGWFIDGVISARVGHVKPEAAIFELAALRFRAEPRDLVFMDDVAANVEVARSLGWDAFQFVTAEQAEHELQRRGLA